MSLKSLDVWRRSFAIGVTGGVRLDVGICAGGVVASDVCSDSWNGGFAIECALENSGGISDEQRLGLYGLGGRPETGQGFLSNSSDIGATGKEITSPSTVGEYDYDGVAIVGVRLATARLYIRFDRL
jgi:hypothetical protein